MGIIERRAGNAGTKKERRRRVRNLASFLDHVAPEMVLPVIW